MANDRHIKLAQRIHFGFRGALPQAHIEVDADGPIASRVLRILQPHGYGKVVGIRGLTVLPGRKRPLPGRFRPHRIDQTEMQDNSTQLLEYVDINHEMRSAVSVLSSLIQESTTKFTVVLDGDLPAVRGNAQKIEQVFVNLIQNACQSLREQNSLLEVRTTREDDSINITIRDEGVGMTAHTLQHATDPFFTTKPIGDGTGLGLSICHKIAEDNGGRIDVESIEGQGATFKIYFPADSPQASI